jgi:hypothetical protein
MIRKIVFLSVCVCVCVCVLLLKIKMDRWISEPKCVNRDKIQFERNQFVGCGCCPNDANEDYNAIGNPFLEAGGFGKH